MRSSKRTMSWRMMRSQPASSACDLREQQAARDAREARLRAPEADLDDCALEADLDAREARLRALEADLDELDLEAVRQRVDAIAATTSEFRFLSAPSRGP